MLKPALARGELRCVGATTLDEYRKHIEKDPALERRFQPVMVREPSVEDTIAILRGLKEQYEVAPQGQDQGRGAGGGGGAVAPLHRRPVPARQGHRPDRRGGRAHPDADRLHARRRWTTIERRIMQLEIERVSVARDKDDPPRASAWPGSTPSWPSSRRRPTRSRAQWQAEKGGIDRLGKIKEEIEAAALAHGRGRARAATADRAAELQHGTLHELERERAELEDARLGRAPARAARCSREEVDEEDIAETVAKWTGIPVTRLLEARGAEAPADGGAPAASA